ncbi:calnexin-like [Oscarella lobularis]|uniref:calnexin-like n=1 Tax=Oscarella lobularis TaxID=121494 RepID=UPI0033133B7C
MAVKGQKFILFVGLVLLEAVAADKENPIPVPSGATSFFEPFASKESFESRWVLSEAKKDGADEAIAKYDGEWVVEEAKESGLEGDLGLVLKSKAKHHGIAAALETPFDFTSSPFVAQYEVKFQEGQECGGAYMKLLTQDTQFDLKDFRDNTPYTVMFGPDKCGNTDKIHFIFRHKNPNTGKFEEKHAKHTAAADYINDHKSHVYTLIINPDNMYQILVDQREVNSGSLLSDFEPPVNPPKEIDDPDDKKPEDWDEREKIPDPEATKPDDWDEDAPMKIPDPDAVRPDDWNDDEPDYIDDPDAAKPDDWDDEEDGTWEAPQIPNPKCQDTGCGPWKAPLIKNPVYKGKWKAPMIDNPNYQGIWKPKKIPNPDFYEDTDPFSRITSIGAIGLELWSMSDDILFDNFLVTDSPDVAADVARQGWGKKSAREGSLTSGMIDSLIGMTEEMPWLWLVYAFVLVLPIVLIAACCCRVKDDSAAATAAAKKKTDEPTPDDPHPKEEETQASKSEKKMEDVKEENEEEEEEEEVDGGDEKADEEKEEKEDENDEGGEDDPADEKDVANAEDAEATEEKEAEEAPPVSSRRTSPRKRKPRKEY